MMEDTLALFDCARVASSNTDAVSLACSSPLAVANMTLAEHRSVFDRILTATITAEEMKASFERLVRDREAIKSELSKLTVKELEKLAQPNWRGQRKSLLISGAVDRMLFEYAFVGAANGVVSVSGFREDERIAGLRLKVSNLTDHDVESSRERRLEQRKAAHERLQKVVDSIKDPQTQDDFETFIRYKGEAALTPEQVARRDALVADRLRATRDAERASRATVEGVDLETGLELVETTHTRDDYPLFVVKLEIRVERSKYDELQAAARRLGGRYSSFNKNGAIPGFQFRDKSAAQQFMAVGRGESADVSDRLAERDAQKKDNAVTRLRDMAATLEEASTQSLSQSRITNTARRANMASRAEAQARRDVALARIMVNLAAAIETGRAYHLEHIREKVQVQQLLATLRSPGTAKSKPRHKDTATSKHVGTKRPPKRRSTTSRFPPITPFGTISPVRRVTSQSAPGLSSSPVDWPGWRRIAPGNNRTGWKFRQRPLRRASAGSVARPASTCPGTGSVLMKSASALPAWRSRQSSNCGAPVASFFSTTARPMRPTALSSSNAISLAGRWGSTFSRRQWSSRAAWLQRLASGPECAFANRRLAMDKSQPAYAKQVSSPTASRSPSPFARYLKRRVSG